jgi:hypothetical protein
LGYNLLCLSFLKIKLIKFKIKKFLKNSNFLVQKVTKFVGNEITANFLFSFFWVLGICFSWMNISDEQPTVALVKKFSSLLHPFLFLANLKRV